jgi:ribonuclease P protein component
MTRPTIQRLTKRAQFLFVRGGARASRPTLTVEARRRAESGPIGLGLTASRKVGAAVLRNRARRRLREAARVLLPEHGLAGVDYVLVARQHTPGAPWPALLDDLGNALIRLRADLEPGAKKRRAPSARSPNQRETSTKGAKRVKGD